VAETEAGDWQSLHIARVLPTGGSIRHECVWPPCYPEPPVEARL